jgi:hypothetical protein
VNNRHINLKLCDIQSFITFVWAYPITMISFLITRGHH